MNENYRDYVNQRDIASHRNQEMWMSFGLGALLGASIALLLAPATGAETRRRVGQFARDASQKARDGVNRASEFINEQRDHLTHAIDEGRHAMEGTESGRPNVATGRTPPRNPQEERSRVGYQGETTGGI